jgi:rubrerythrin
MRLASIYALLDKSPLVRREHLEAAFALWQYAKDSARYIFGTATGNKLADEIFAALEGAGEPGLTRTDISNVLGRNRSASEIERALRLLFEYGKARTKQEIADDAKRPTERWYALTRQNEINETNELIAESEPLAKDNFVEIVNFVEEPREDIPRTEADLLFDSKPIVEDIATADTAGQPSSFPCWECGASCSSEDSHCPSCDHDLAAVPFEKKILLIQEGQGRGDENKTENPLPKILPGSVHQQYVRCGKAKCKCARGELHGAYYHFYARLEDSGSAISRRMKSSRCKLLVWLDVKRRKHGAYNRAKVGNILGKSTRCCVMC